MAISDELFEKLRQAFLGFGYEQATMSGLARACGLTRRALYHHFSNKEEAFRHVLSVANEVTIRAGMNAARRALDGGADAVEVITVLMDTRYGEARRALIRPLIALRQKHVAPHIDSARSLGASALGDRAFVAAWSLGASTLTLFVNFGDAEVGLDTTPSPSAAWLHGSAADVASASRGVLPARRTLACLES